MRSSTALLLLLATIGTCAVFGRVFDEEMSDLDNEDGQSVLENAEPTSLVQKAQTTMLWGRRRRHRHHRHRRQHNHGPRLQGGGQRKTCECIGDPHCKPFCGHFFDIHYIGVFRLAKIGTEEVQMATYQCDGKQKWSGGLTVKCNKAIGVRRDDNNVMTVHKDQGAKFNARALRGCKSQSGARFCKSPGRASGSYTGKKMNVRMKRQNFKAGAMCVYIDLKGASTSQTSGVCGSGCGKLFPGRGGGKFPCKNCRAGVGIWGGMCPCKEFMTTNQIFTHKFRIPTKQPPIKAPVIDKNKIRRLSVDCLETFKKTPFGRIAWQHKATAKLARTLAKTCALDRYGSKKNGNEKKNAMMGSMCTSVRMMVRKSKTDPLLCKMLAKCGSKSKKCLLEKKRTPGKFMERKRRLVQPANNKAGGGGGGGDKIAGLERQQQRKGNKTRQRKRTGAGTGKYTGCKVTKQWANKHLNWCKWSGWDQWS